MKSPCNLSLLPSLPCSLLLFSLFLLCAPLSFAQSIDSVEYNLYRQLLSSPHEKVYVSTDKPSYVSGEKIWFRAFLVDANLLTEYDALSRYVYVDLIDPKGEVVIHHQLRPDSIGLYHNCITLAEDMPEGHYLLRAYTYFMLGEPDYIFKKTIFIADPLSARLSVEPTFSNLTARNKSVYFTFHDIRDNSKVSVNNFSMRAGSGELNTFPAADEISFRSQNTDSEVLYIEADYQGRRLRKYIPVPTSAELSVLAQSASSTADDFDVSFFPEGGYLIESAACKVGFKALGTNGLSEAVTGELYDGDGNLITSFRSGHGGIGTIAFNVYSRGYYAICTNDKGASRRFDLPEPSSRASTVTATWRNDMLVVQVNRGRESSQRQLYLLAHTKGMPVYTGIIPQNNTLLIDGSDIPSGIIQLLLLDEDMNTLSERIVFRSGDDLPQTEISTDKPDYGRRELVKVSVKVADVADGVVNGIINGTASVSVLDERDILPDSTLSIVSSLLLCSELRGHIENPEYYFTDDPQAKLSLDALMLTQGWRRYNIPAVVKGEITLPGREVELGQQISGQVKSLLLGQPVEGADVLAVGMDKEGEQGYFDYVTTDKDGRFVFGFELPDSTVHMVKALLLRDDEPSEPTNLMTALKQGRNTSLNLILDIEERMAGELFRSPIRILDRKFTEYVEKSDLAYSQEFGMRTIEIAPLTVSAERIQRGKSMYSSAFGDIISAETLEKYFYYIPFVLRMNGVSVSQRVSDTGMLTTYLYVNTGRADPRPAVIVVDNMVMDPEFDITTMIDNNTIEEIEVLRPPISFSLGPRGIDGAVLFTSKKGDGGGNNKPVFNIAMATPTGYRLPEEFYSPRYDTPEQRSSTRSDIRTTLFWKPDLIITNGEAEFEFYTADTRSTYSIVIEGLTDDGKIVRRTTTTTDLALR